MHEHNESCREVFALLSQYLDRDLPAQNCDAIREHLADCPPCIEFFDSLRKTVTLCHECESADKPAPLDDASRERMKAAWRAALGRCR